MSTLQPELTLAYDQPSPVRSLFPPPPHPLAASSLLPPLFLLVHTKLILIILPTDASIHLLLRLFACRIIKKNISLKRIHQYFENRIC